MLVNQTKWNETLLKGTEWVARLNSTCITRFRLSGLVFLPVLCTVLADRVSLKRDSLESSSRTTRLIRRLHDEFVAGKSNEHEKLVSVR